MARPVNGIEHAIAMELFSPRSMTSTRLAQFQQFCANNVHLMCLLAALAVICGHAYPVVGIGDADLYLQWDGSKFIGGVAVVSCAMDESAPDAACCGHSDERVGRLSV